ncbi:MAG: PaaI family thioesterase [Chloroflexota bacterium]
MNLPESETSTCEYPDPLAPERVHREFASQQIIQMINARLVGVAPGLVHIELDYQTSLTQQNGYIHAGILSTLVDSACGFAAFSLMPAGSRVLSVEFKVNFMSPARGEKFLASGRVVRSGRTLMVCSGEVLAYSAGIETPVALMQATMMRLPGEASSNNPFHLQDK